MKGAVRRMIRVGTFTMVLALVIAGCSMAGPEAAYDPSPMDGATGVLAGVDLTWVGSEGATFNVFFGTTNPPPEVATGISAELYDPAPADDLVAGTTYYWRIDSVVGGATVAGDVWSFTLAP